MKNYLLFVRSTILDALATACCVLLFAIFLAQCGREAMHASDTGHAAYVGLRGGVR